MYEVSVLIKGINITMTQGDTLNLPISIYYKDENGETKPYEPVEGDSVRFAVKERGSVDTLINKDIPIETMILHLNPEDTKQLVPNQQYMYDIQITMNDGTVDTFIPSSPKEKAKFIVVEEAE